MCKVIYSGTRILLLSIILKTNYVGYCIFLILTEPHYRLLYYKNSQHILQFYCSIYNFTLSFTVPQETEADNGFGDFLSSPPATQTDQPTNQNAASISVTNQNPGIQNTHNPPLQQTKVSPPKKDKKGLKNLDS